MKKACVLTVQGRVQKVGFRYFTRKQAIAHNIQGYVRNEPNGDVYIYAEGKEEDLNQFIAKCSKGPLWSKVTHLDIAPSHPTEMDSFSIK